MAKSEQPQIYMKRRGNQLFPEMQADADLIMRLSADTRIKITVTEGRSPAKLRLYWAYLGRVVKSCNCAPSPEALHELIKLETGFTTPVKLRGYTVLVPRSISFSSMNEPEFSDFFENAVQFIASAYGITPEQAFGEAA